MSKSTIRTGTMLTNIWRISRPSRSSEQGFYGLDDDAFKKRGQAFENEYIRRQTNELLTQIRKRIETENRQKIKEQLQREKSRLEDNLKELDGKEDDKDNKE
ncbi:hypothetical protein GWI33_012483 [Rhynchophorus ferrugineus]|uniref:Uncharacterized protein n=1 Tax=Rhynchophorus ferrugineus TaxID=354439 RepID=A0A834IBB0_RHYFE|nr:hypothetical protein GWI33_012483 [Rhynchophorus ferrugineus]